MHYARVAMLCALAIGLIAGGLAIADEKPPPPKITSISVTATPLASFEKGEPAKTAYGELTWRGGLVLKSDAEDFGGWSALTYDADGQTLLAISDAGAWMRARLDHEGRAPKGLSNVTIGPLKSRDGRVLARDWDRDSESAALLSGSFQNGSVLVGFERNCRIAEYPIVEGELGTPSRLLKIPAEAKNLRNEGFEALTVMHGGAHKGAIVAFAEEPLKGTRLHSGWMWINGEPKRFSLAGAEGYGLTDAASLSDGTLLVLARRFRWIEGVKMRLIRIKPQDLEPGAEIAGEVLLDAGMSQEIDNMEGLAVAEQPDGRAVLTLISDDNFNHLLQRTVLLEFELKAPAAAAASGTSTR